MYERFTDRARKVMQLANQEAQRVGHEYIGTEHLLVGLVKEGSGVSGSVLRNLGVSLVQVRAELEKLVPPGVCSDQVVLGKLPHTPRTKKVVEWALHEARDLNHNYIGTEHLLLGLLREPEGAAARALAACGLTLEAARKEVVRVLASNQPEAIPEAGPVARPNREFTYVTVGGATFSATYAELAKRRGVPTPEEEMVAAKVAAHLFSQGKIDINAARAFLGMTPATGEFWAVPRQWIKPDEKPPEPDKPATPEPPKRGREFI